MKAHLHFLQETQFHADRIPKFCDSFFPMVYRGCSSDSKSKGVSILLRNLIPWALRNQWCDAEGRAPFVKGTISCTLVTLKNLYFPNSNQISFLELVLAKLGEFAEGAAIVWGDMNLTLDRVLDASRDASHVSYAALKRVKNFQAFHLVDICVYFIRINRTIPFTLTPMTRTLELTSSCCLKHAYQRLRRHSLVQSLFRPMQWFLWTDSSAPKPWMRKLNDSLLQTSSVAEVVSREFRLFFFSTVTSDSAPNI